MDNCPAHTPRKNRGAMDGLRYGSSPPRQAIRANAFFLKNDEQKEVGQGLSSRQLSYLSLRFKIGEPSCLATLKRT